MNYKQYIQLGQSISEGLNYPGTGRSCKGVGHLLDRDLREKEKDEERRKRLEEQGNNREYIMKGATYRLLYNRLPYNQETISQFMSLREEIINLINRDELSKDDLQSLYYGMLGERGSRGINVYIEGLHPEEIKNIGINDALYLKAPLDPILSKNKDYMEGYSDGIAQSLNHNNEPLDEVAQLLIERLEEKKKNRRR